MVVEASAVGLDSSQPVKARGLVVADLHLSDKYSGRHVDYFRDCIEFLEKITETIKVYKITHLILTGDLFGRTTEKNLQSRDSLLYVMKVFQVWNQMTNGNVYSVLGNHDISHKLTDFQLLVSLGLLKRVPFVDVGAVRFHLIDYGDHKRAVDIDSSKYNVAVMHANLQIEGITTWFRGGNDGVELSSLDNLYGVDFVISGHIHNPSIRLVETSIKDKTVQLFYPGNGTRPKYERDLWDKCYGVILETTATDDVNFKLVEYKLRPVEEVFQLTYEDVSTEEEESISDAPIIDIQQLSAILEELKNYNLLGESDYKTQIKKLGGIDKEAVDLALQYIEMVEGELK